MTARLLAWLPRTHLRGGSQGWHAFKACVYAGIALGCLIGASLGVAEGLPVVVLGEVALAAWASFFLLGMVEKVICGREVFVYYHHALAAMGTTAFVVWQAHQPFLPYLDLTAIGTGFALAVIRVGCLMVGCCRGRLSRWGISYGAEHVAEGFPAGCAGLHFLPVQGIESLLTLAVSAVGAGLILLRTAPGTPLVWYVTAYATLRYALEFLRGDGGRAYLAGLSQAQWISLGLLATIREAGRRGLLAHPWWSTLPLVVLAVLTAVLVARSLSGNRVARQLTSARHVEEVAQILSDVAVQPTNEGVVQLHRTSLGVLVSGGSLPGWPAQSEHYAISFQEPVPDPERAARRLAGIILLARHPGGRGALVAGPGGTFHVIYREGFPDPVDVVS